RARFTTHASGKPAEACLLSTGTSSLAELYAGTRDWGLTAGQTADPILRLRSRVAMPREPGWRNRQTHRTQNPAPARAWGVDSPSRHPQAGAAVPGPGSGSGGADSGAAGGVIGGAAGGAAGWAG